MAYLKGRRHKEREVEESGERGEQRVGKKRDL